MYKNYTRVVPRDLFNEAKLLKCLGQLFLIYHDGVDANKSSLPVGFRIEHDDSEAAGFSVVQNQDDGGLEVANINCSYKGFRIRLYSSYNSRQAYPLNYDIEGGNTPSGEVFNEDGSLSGAFLEDMLSLHKA